MNKKTNISLKLLRMLSLSSVIFLSCVPVYSDQQTMEPTPSHIEGLYYKTDSPERHVLLEKGISGTKLMLKGRVFSTQGATISGVRLDFWQADAEGNYDSKGFRLRAHQFSDAKGRYWIETIVPASYLNRVPHIHVSLRLPNGRTLTTQLFLPEDSHNRSDPLYKENLSMKVHDTQDGKEASFDFILDISK